MSYRVAPPRAPRRPYSAPRFKRLPLRLVASIAFHYDESHRERFLRSLREGWHRARPDLDAEIEDWLAAIEHCQHLPVGEWSFAEHRARRMFAG